MKLSRHILYHAGEASSHSWICTLTLHPSLREERGGGLQDLASCRSWHLCKALEQHSYPQRFGGFSSLFLFVYFAFNNKKKNWMWKTTMLNSGFPPFGLWRGISSGHLRCALPHVGETLKQVNSTEFCMCYFSAFNQTVVISFAGRDQNLTMAKLLLPLKEWGLPIPVGSADGYIKSILEVKFDSPFQNKRSIL